MDGTSRILFVVEGEKTERQLVNRLSEIFGVSSTVYSVKGNIYKLYQAVKDDPFIGITDILSEMEECSEADRMILSKGFTDVFLVFDCDAQHTICPEESKCKTAFEIAVRNMRLVRKMAERFNESTDPERGKLLVNYPMVEAFRDCDEFYDESYSEAIVPVTELGEYKKRVAKRRLVRFHIKDYSRKNFCDLMRMNIFILNKILSGRFEAYPYKDFLSNNDQMKIAEEESRLVEQNSMVSVLNTLLFFPVEYFGNVNGFYDNVLDTVNLH